MDLNMFAYMVENGYVDENLSVIPKCPICERQLVKTHDSYYTFYCNNCNKSFTRDLAYFKDHSPRQFHILKRGSKKQ